MHKFAFKMNIYSVKNKVQRQIEIRKIIQGGNVHSQEQLLTALKNKGYDLTQATLSRDLKVLQVAKVPHPVKGYVYTIPSGKEQSLNSTEQIRVNYLADGFQSLQFSGSLAVLRTLPGYASSFAVIIDQSDTWEILGTVAGDDTILIIQREGISKNDLMEALIKIMPKLREKL
jgi:transcriptional regulator of arginine metabolism